MNDNNKNMARPSKEPLVARGKAIRIPVSTEKPVQDKFWTNKSGKYKLDPESLHVYLVNRGYRSYKPAGVKATILVKIEGNLIREISKEEIWELCWNYIDLEYHFTDGEERRQVKDTFQRSRSLFHIQNLSLLRTVEINECKDTKDMSYIFFADCVLAITANQIQLKEYADIENQVFETDIHSISIKPFIKSENNIILSIVPEGEFYEFIQDLCKNEDETINQDSLESLKTIIGYLVHRYKNPSLSKAVIFMDTYIDDNANGRTGKGLLTKALDYVRKTAFIDGKRFNFKNRFELSEVGFSTRIIRIDDIPKDFKFEDIFPLITERATVEHKYEDSVSIPYELSPKIVITTNYTVKGTGASHEGRKAEFILSNTYNADYSPQMKFGHLFFYEWDDKEWVNFYLLIAHCVQEFLNKGLVQPRFNVAERELKIEATSEFIKHINENVDPGVKLNKKEVYDDFYTKNPNHYKIELTTFNNWLQLYARAYGFKMNTSHSGSDYYFEFYI